MTFCSLLLSLLLLLLNSTIFKGIYWLILIPFPFRTTTFFIRSQISDSIFSSLISLSPVALLLLRCIQNSIIQPVDMKRKRTTAMIFYFSAAMAWAKALSRSAFQSSNLQRRSKFTITAPYPPTADQPQAIQSLVERFERGDKFAVLRGCTGTGKYVF